MKANSVNDLPPSYTTKTVNSVSWRSREHKSSLDRVIGAEGRAKTQPKGQP